MKLSPGEERAEIGVSASRGYVQKNPTGKTQVRWEYLRLGKVRDPDLGALRTSDREGISGSTKGKVTET